MKTILNRDQLDKWHDRYLSLAEHVASWSKDPSTKVGSVIVGPDDRRLISVGFNGFPMGVRDTDERLLDRAIKYQLVQHAELNAMGFAERSLEDCTMYVWPFMTCPTCTGHAIQKGINRIVAPYSDNERWIEGFKLSEQMLDETEKHLILVK